MNSVPTPSQLTPAHGRQRENLYVRLRDLVVSGEFTPGQAMPEIALAEYFGVSRTPIREALTRLEQDGLLERSDRGLIVRMRSPEDVIDLYETRIALETAACRTAAERRTDRDVIQLRALAERVSQTPTSDPRAMVASNSAFHRAIWQAGRNRSLCDLLERLAMHLGQYPETTLSYPGRWESANEQHRAIVDSIADRDEEKAAELAAIHFTESRDIRIKLWIEKT